MTIILICPCKIHVIARCALRACSPWSSLSRPMGSAASY